MPLVESYHLYSRVRLAEYYKNILFTNLVHFRNSTSSPGRISRECLALYVLIIFRYLCFGPLKSRHICFFVLCVWEQNQKQNPNILRSTAKSSHLQTVKAVGTAKLPLQSSLHPNPTSQLSPGRTNVKSLAARAGGALARPSIRQVRFNSSYRNKSEFCNDN